MDRPLRAWLARGWILTLLLWIPGCGTVFTVYDGNLQAYGGIATDVLLLDWAGPLLLFDLPFSFVADTTLLPLTLPITILGDMPPNAVEEPGVVEEPYFSWLEDLADDDPGVREAAARRLEDRHAKEPVRATRALRLGLNDERWRLRSTCARLLARRGATGAAQDLSHLLTDPEGSVRLECARALGVLGRAARVAVGALIKALYVPDAGLRAASLAALEKIGWRDRPEAEFTLPALVRDLRLERRDPAHTARVVALCRVARRPLAVRAALLAATPEVRAHLTRAVPLETLLVLLDPREDVTCRRFAANALRLRRAVDPAARIALERAIRDPDPEVRRLVEEDR